MAADTKHRIVERSADVFPSWVDAATERLVQSGLPRQRSRSLVVSMLALLEGAFVLARALRSTEPLEIAGASATALAREAVAAQRRRRRAGAGQDGPAG